jgi:hypothetical protein
MEYIEYLKKNILAYHDQEGDGVALDSNGIPVIDTQDWFDQELDDYVNRMWNSEREEFLAEYGIANAIQLHADNYGGTANLMDLVYCAMKDKLESDEEIKSFLS